MRKLFLIVFIVLAAAGVSAEPLDFVVLLDISQSMLPYFDDTVNYLIRDILKQHLAPSDGFHLLTFADSPGVELTFEIGGSQDVDDALNRILLLQPLGQYTDLVSALKFVYSYTLGVRENSHKKILILTDGIHDPPPSSPYPVDGDIYMKTASEVAKNIRKKGWDVSLVQFPAAEAAEAVTETSEVQQERPGDGEAPAEAERQDRDGAQEERAEGEEGPAVQQSTDVVPEQREEDVPADRPGAAAARQRPDGEGVPDGAGADETGAAAAWGQGGRDETKDDLFPALAEDLDIDVVPYTQPDGDINHRALGAPELVFPEDLGRVGYTFTLPLSVRNLSGDRILVELTEMLWRGTDVLDAPVSAAVPPESTAELRAKIRIPSAVEPGPMTLELEAGFADDLRIYPRQGSVSIVLRERIFGNAGRTARLLPILGYIGIALGGIAALVLLVFAVRALVARGISTLTAPVTKPMGSMHDRAIEMYVEGQNRNIGTRNVHHIRNNDSASVGGGFSTFLICLYKVPAKIGVITRKEERYSFRPVKLEFFENPATVEDCIDKDITVICGSGRKVNIRFRRYISELEKINSIMRLVKKPQPEAPEEET